MEEEQQQKDFVEVSVRGAPAKGGGGEAPPEELKKMEAQLAAQPQEQTFMRTKPMRGGGGSDAGERESLEQQEQLQRLEQAPQRTASVRGGGATEPD